MGVSVTSSDDDVCRKAHVLGTVMYWSEGYQWRVTKESMSVSQAGLRVEIQRKAASLVGLDSR